MALIGSGVRASYSPSRQSSGNTAHALNRGAFNSKGQMLALQMGFGGWDGSTNAGKPFGRPSGLGAPAAWHLPVVAGALQSRSGRVSVDGQATGSRGLPTTASETISVDGSALGQLIVAGIATATITVNGTATPQAQLSTSASETISVNGTIAVEGRGSISGSATLSVNGNAASGGFGSIVASDAAEGLTPDALARAVWSAVASSNNTAGTMGEKLNDAGSAANPWTEVIEGTYTAAQLMRVIAATLAGKLSGANTATITIRGIADTKDRVIATVDADGNRANVVLDVS